MSAAASPRAEYEYVVVGSGAGGGTVAARLAEEGHRVLLLEAGGDPLKMQGGDPVEPDGKRLPADYLVPVFTPMATENDAMKWSFFVRHYASDALQRRDPKYTEEWDGERVDGVLYPRAGCLGGCTAHNAMITVSPHNEDWDFIAKLTGDSSWSASNMRKYFQRVEDCHHRPFWRLLAKLGINPTRHGWRGWLRTEKSIPKAALEDKGLVATIIDSAAAETEDLGSSLIERIKWFVQGKGDPNDWRLVEENAVGLRYTPLATRKHARNGARERVIDVAKRFPKLLTVELDALATRVLFDDANRALGVEYLKGTRLYRAHKDPSRQAGEKRQAFASREVILSGGAYNTPQLLMLSGIGPRAELEKHDILPVRVDLPGVGSNLQDRYEVGVVNRMNFKAWWVLKGAKFSPGDPQYRQWDRKRRKGVYTSNGAVLGVIKRSVPDRPLPDIFCFGLLGTFKGFFPNYSKLFPEHLNILTWCILKAHTKNTAGTVRLHSADPRAVPQINFHYFSEGNDEKGEDLQSVVEAIKFVRKMTAPLKRRGLIAEEELPGDAVRTDEQLAQFVQDQAWGHHASCTCAIGDRAKGGVLNGDFQVHGTKGLRVVDASVFPKIPGFFIVSSVYTIGEKAADVILKSAE